MTRQAGNFHESVRTNVAVRHNRCQGERNDLFMNACDLHLHSTASDGTFTPTQVVELAREKGLEAIALTDHDSLAGVAEAKDAGKRLGIRVLSGVEISVEYVSKTVHMLAYCFDAGSAVLQAAMAKLVEGRDERNRKIVKRLAELGMTVDYDEVVAEASGDVVARPHFARVLIRQGYVADMQEAFDKYLARGCPAYCERLRFSPDDAVALIREAGGVSVLAHPKFIVLHEGENLDDLVRTLKKAGLAGIECHYSLHSEEETAEYLELAERYDLIVTGGSDFHGDAKDGIEMGTGLGNLHVPVSCADALEEYAARLA
jgi:predicted metal-dependent phosphoesterase TrpH